MSPRCVTTVLSWLQRSEKVTYENQQLTLYNLFKIAMYQSFGYWNENLLQSDIARFQRDGYLPAYLVRFLRDRLYPLFITRRPFPLRLV